MKLYYLWLTQYSMQWSSLMVSENDSRNKRKLQIQSEFILVPIILQFHRSTLFSERWYNVNLFLEHLRVDVLNQPEIFIFILVFFVWTCVWYLLVLVHNNLSLLIYNRIPIEFLFSKISLSIANSFVQSHFFEKMFLFVFVIYNLIYRTYYIIMLMIFCKMNKSWSTRIDLIDKISLLVRCTSK